MQVDISGGMHFDHVTHRVCEQEKLVQDPDYHAVFDTIKALVTAHMLLASTSLTQQTFVAFSLQHCVLGVVHDPLSWLQMPWMLMLVSPIRLC